MVLLWKGELKQKTVLVTERQKDAVTLQIGAKTCISVPVADILSCDYARGDHGED